ncbi:MAG: hypothetical protein JNL32_11290 [Candidatus Kapabacteria bacterium]|nr:hypothetical protein [Candidatus Kapabacteria bacterium]
MLLADSVFSSLISYSTAHGVAIGNPYSVILYTRGNVRHNHAVIDDSIIGIGAFYVDYGQRSLVLKTWRRVDGMFVELREIEAEVSGMINNYLGSIADDVLSQGSYKSNSILHVFSKSNVDTMRRVSKTFEYRLSHDHDTFYDKLTEYKKHMK